MRRDVNQDMQAPRRDYPYRLPGYNPDESKDQDKDDKAMCNIIQILGEYRVVADIGMSVFPAWHTSDA